MSYRIRTERILLSCTAYDWFSSPFKESRKAGRGPVVSLNDAKRVDVSRSFLHTPPGPSKRAVFQRPFRNCFFFSRSPDVSFTASACRAGAECRVDPNSGFVTCTSQRRITVSGERTPRRTGRNKHGNSLADFVRGRRMKETSSQSWASIGAVRTLRVTPSTRGRGRDTHTCVYDRLILCLRIIGHRFMSASYFPLNVWRN